MWRPGRDVGRSGQEASDGLHHDRGLLGVGVVAGTLDDLEPGTGDPGRQLGLVLGREQEVVAPGDDEGWSPDLADPMHHAPSGKEMTTRKDERLAAEHGAPLTMDQIARHHPQERQALPMEVRTTEAEHRRLRSIRRDPPAEEAAHEPNDLRAV